jgi:hypothetical protein
MKKSIWAISIVFTIFLIWFGLVHRADDIFYREGVILMNSNCNVHVQMINKQYEIINHLTYIKTNQDQIIRILQQITDEQADEIEKLEKDKNFKFIKRVVGV